MNVILDFCTRVTNNMFHSSGLVVASQGEFQCCNQEMSSRIKPFHPLKPSCSACEIPGSPSPRRPSKVPKLKSFTVVATSNSSKLRLDVLNKSHFNDVNVYMFTQCGLNAK